MLFWMDFLTERILLYPWYQFFHSFFEFEITFSKKEWVQGGLHQSFITGSYTVFWVHTINDRGMRKVKMT